MERADKYHINAKSSKFYCTKVIGSCTYQNPDEIILTLIVFFHIQEMNNFDYFFKIKSFNPQKAQNWIKLNARN